MQSEPLECECELIVCDFIKVLRLQTAKLSESQIQSNLNRLPHIICYTLFFKLININNNILIWCVARDFAK